MPPNRLNQTAPNQLPKGWNRFKISSTHFALPFTHVVYLDQRTGALHAFCWSKSFVSVWKQVFCLFPFLSFPLVMEKDEITYSLHSWFYPETNNFDQRSPHLLVEIHNAHNPYSNLENGPNLSCDFYKCIFQRSTLKGICFAVTKMWNGI